MKIIRLIIKDAYRELFNKNFKCKNLIWSQSNSKGKTTLIRFILFSLGYDVPSTKKINMKSYITELEIENNNKFFVLIRNKNIFTVKCDSENFKKEYNLDVSDIQAQSIFLGIDNVKLIENLLGTYYIDQEKGWTLINRGRVISSKIRFNIEDFILGLSNVDVSDLDVKINGKSAEINRYSAILNVVELDEIQQDDYKEDENLIRLKNQKANIMYNIGELDNQINDLSNLIDNNNNLVKMIESYKISIRVDGDKQIRVDRNNIVDFNINQFMLESQRKELLIEKTFLNEKLKDIIDKLSAYDTLVNVDDISKQVVKQVKESSLNQVNLEHLIEELKKEKKGYEKQKDDIVESKSEIVTYIVNKIKEYATQIGVYEGYIDKETNYLFTSNLKEYSGALYHKVTLCYRLAYYSAIKKYHNIDLPFIIDSPGSAEVDSDGMKAIIELVNDVVKDNQIIVSSIFDDELGYDYDNKIILQNGIFSD
ncbi:MAG: hypothetical protein IJS83_06565 [Acholeplasmatales bacterium]|nr:hypothetical protein [Acholeplasmatales bacterium]